MTASKRRLSLIRVDKCLARVDHGFEGMIHDFGCNGSNGRERVLGMMCKVFYAYCRDSYADLRIENMPEASMSRSVGMNRRTESGSVPARPWIFQGLFAVVMRAEAGRDKKYR